MSDAEAEPEVAPGNGEAEEEACVEVKVEKKRREHGLYREEQQNVVVQPLLTGKSDLNKIDMNLMLNKSEFWSLF